MKKMICSLLVVFLCVVAFAQAANENVITIKVNCLENEEHGQGVFCNTFKQELEKLSGGKIKVNVFLNASLYTQDGALPAIISGDLEMNLTSFQVTAEYYKGISMLTVPYVFKGYDHMRAVMDSEVGEYLAEEISKAAGYYPIIGIYNGSRELNLRTSTPVTKPEDLASTVLRMPNSAAWIAAGESLGAKVTPLAYSEVYTALQMGTIDAQDNPLPSVKTMKFYEVTKQISLTNHITDCVLVTINTKFWNSLTAEQQGWIRQAAKAGQEACDSLILKQEAELCDFFASQGLIIVNPDIDAFAAYSYDYYVSHGLTADWDMDLYNRIQALAK